MEAIIIDVPLETAKNWLEIPKGKRKKITSQFMDQINIEASKIKKQKFLKSLDEIGEVAKRNGLTQEILEEILNEK